MALIFLLDTNILLYHLSGRLSEPIPDGDLLVSVITEMELLSYPNLRSTEEAAISKLLADIRIIELTSSIKAEAIRLRRTTQLKLPDAIVVASAKVMGATLISNDATLVKATTPDTISLKIN